MASADITQVAELLKPTSKEVFNGKGKLCLSTNYLHKLNCVLEDNITNGENNTSFNILPTNTKSKLIRDVQFLVELVERAHSLKIIPDVINDNFAVNIERFKNIEVLEIQKVDIGNVLGLQKLRSRLQQISCFHCINCIGEFLEKCGGDNSQPYIWSELKKASFSHNKILELKDSFEYTPWLHTLDLSHNEITSADCLNRLHNLKHLNLSYNKLDSVPFFKGQLCSRLQILIMKNNFIEDIGGLGFLNNLVQLDVSQNCLLDHRSLMSISHLASLQWLNLQDNPLAWHPHHRNLTCQYLSKNTISLKFVLDNEPLTKSEKVLSGSLHPMNQQASLTSSTSSLLDYSPSSMASDRPRRVRNVTIEDESVVKLEKAIVLPPQESSSQHLEIKKQVEQLREEFGVSWLNKHSGLLVQDVLGIEKNSDLNEIRPFLSSTPHDSLLTSYNTAIDSSVNVDISESEVENLHFDTATNESTVFDNLPVSSKDDISDVSDGEDVDGEECIYLATVQGESDQVLVVVTQTHISERDSTTSKEKARWHINTVLTCDILEDNPDAVKLEFDTVRRDRKQRLYVLDGDEAKSFYNSIKDSMNKITPNEMQITMYQCMKCSEVFPQNRNKWAMKDITCPKCESNLVIENV